MSQKRSAFSSGLLLLLIGALVAAAYLMPSGGKDPEFRPLSSPEDVHQVGWWRRSVRPGNDHGQTVLTGHTVHTGGGVMNRLTQLHPGNVVRVVTPKGTMVYRTTKVMTLSKAQLARRSTALFGQGRDSNRLVLVTCTGWTGSTYTSNVVAFAEPLGVRAHPAKKKS
jgi:LPXTG-site transpeptidase (sortase) family protein